MDNQTNVWVHCSKCFLVFERPEQSSETIIFTNCGHFLCRSCYPCSLPQTTTSCPACGAMCQMTTISCHHTPPQIQDWLEDPLLHFERTLKVLKFQREHQNNLIRHLRERVHQLENDLEQINLCRSQRPESKDTKYFSLEDTVQQGSTFSTNPGPLLGPFTPSSVPSTPLSPDCVGNPPKITASPLSECQIKTTARIMETPELQSSTHGDAVVPVQSSLSRFKYRPRDHCPSALQPQDDCYIEYPNKTELSARPTGPLHTKPNKASPPNKPASKLQSRLANFYNQNEKAPSPFQSAVVRGINKAIAGGSQLEKAAATRAKRPSLSELSCQPTKRRGYPSKEYHFNLAHTQPCSSSGSPIVHLPKQALEQPPPPPPPLEPDAAQMNASENSKRAAIPIDDHQATSDNGLRDHDGQQQRNRDTRDADMAIAEHDEGGAVGGQRRAVEQPLNPLRNSLEDQLPDLPTLPHTSAVDLFARLKQAQQHRNGCRSPKKKNN